jgi:UDP-glucose 4-epimerase
MKKPRVLVTGGTGYIGSHTLIELINNGYDVVSIDNLSRSSSKSLNLIKEITGCTVKNFDVDLCSEKKLSNIFAELGEVAGVIHFAAFKSVPESVQQPELYYYNNLFSLVNILKCCIQHNIKHFVFSSSCSVYGDIASLPVSETTVLTTPKSPYAVTKVMGEKIVQDTCKANSIAAISLRYFNPVGAHPSGLIGEMPLNTPDNLVPVITQTAIGKRKSLTVFGGNLPTRDGSCIRDFVHVTDIANAHVLALQHLKDKQDYYDVVNLGTGEGVSIFEAINTFEKVSGVKLNYKVGAYREGDVIEIYSDGAKSDAVLGWKPKYTIVDMMSSAWKWELQLQKMESKEEGFANSETLADKGS